MIVSKREAIASGNAPPRRAAGGGSKEALLTPKHPPFFVDSSTHSATQHPQRPFRPRVVPTDTWLDAFCNNNRVATTQQEVIDDRGPRPSPPRPPDTPPADGGVGRYTAPSDLYRGVRVLVSPRVTSGGTVFRWRGRLWVERALNVPKWGEIGRTRPPNALFRSV